MSGDKVPALAPTKLMEDSWNPIPRANDMVQLLRLNLAQRLRGSISLWGLDLAPKVLVQT